MAFKVLTASGVPDTEINPTFFQRMADAMGLSFFKYGRVSDAYPQKVDAIASLKIRLARYDETGNGDYLIDVANFAMIEFTHPRHPEAHYHGGDSDTSPGRAWVSGGTSERANTTGQENVRIGGSNRVTTGGFYKREGD